MYTRKYLIERRPRVPSSTLRAAIGKTQQSTSTLFVNVHVYSIFVVLVYIHYRVMPLRLLGETLNNKTKGVRSLFYVKNFINQLHLSASSFCYGKIYRGIYLYWLYFCTDTVYLSMCLYLLLNFVSKFT